MHALSTCLFYLKLTSKSLGTLGTKFEEHGLIVDQKIFIIKAHEFAEVAV
jgi:hypothetical protein